MNPALEKITQLIHKLAPSLALAPASRPSARARIGANAERRAQRFLERRGLRTVAKNYRVRGGELDLVMRDGETLAFVEVRCRRDCGYGNAVESVDWRKQARIMRASELYLAQRPHHGPVRYDIVAFDGEAAPPVWLRAAFRQGL